MKRRVDAPDWLYRLVYRQGSRVARLWWRFAEPRATGADVVIWHRERFILLRSSYRREWMVPGGGVKPGERPVDAALRETAEEIGLRLREEDLRLVRISQHYWENRHQTIHLFEARLSAAPAVQTDNREIVEARFVTAAEARMLPLVPHLLAYLSPETGTILE
jgi:8-oxo-dGTP diphosphatase